MKYLIAILALVIIGCEQPTENQPEADGPGAVAPGPVAPIAPIAPPPVAPIAPTPEDPAAVQAAIDAAAFARINGNTWGSEWPFIWCTDDGSGWVCGPIAPSASIYNPLVPVACDAPGVWPIATNGLSYMGGGFGVLNDRMLFDVWHPIEFTDGVLHITDLNLHWALDQIDDNHVVLSYGEGCSLRLQKGDIEQWWLY